MYLSFDIFIYFDFLDDDKLTPYHPNLEIIFNELRNRIFMSPRRQMYNGSAELTESLWFDLVTSTMLNKNNFFLTTYEEIRRKKVDVGQDNM